MPESHAAMPDEQRLATENTLGFADLDDVGVCTDDLLGRPARRRVELDVHNGRIIHVVLDHSRSGRAQVKDSHKAIGGAHSAV